MTTPNHSKRVLREHLFDIKTTVATGTDRIDRFQKCLELWSTELTRIGQLVLQADGRADHGYTVVKEQSLNQLHNPFPAAGIHRSVSLFDSSSINQFIDSISVIFISEEPK